MENTTEFQWTDELVQDYVFYYTTGKGFNTDETMNRFKQSKVKKEEDTYHKCKYCGAMVWGESDEGCYANPNNKSHIDIGLEEKTKESPLPIKVTEIVFIDLDTPAPFKRTFFQVPTEKYEPIKKAIESVLRNDSELTEQNDLWCIADILSRIWHYGGMKVETSNERVIYGILNKLGLYPTTEEKILMRPNWGDKFLEHNKWPNDKGLPQKYFTKDELLEAQQKAFYAATESIGVGSAVIGEPFTIKAKYPTFTDYLESLNKGK